MGKVGGAIEGVDAPKVVGGGVACQAALLAEDGMAGAKGAAHNSEACLLCCLVGFGDNVGRGCLVADGAWLVKGVEDDKLGCIGCLLSNVE